MHPLAIPCIAMAAVNAAVGGYYLALYLGWPKVQEHLPFALMCFGIATYDVACAGLYDAHSLDVGVFWQGIQLAMPAPIAASALWFAMALTDRPRGRLFRGLMVTFAVLFVTTLVLRVPGITLSPLTPAVKHITWAGRPLVTYYESSLGLLTNLSIGLALVVNVYLLVILWQGYRERSSRPLLAIVIGILVYFVAVMSDTLVANRVYPFVYVSEYAYMVLVAVMAGGLLLNFVGLHRSVEALNRQLEGRVETAMTDLRVLSGLLPICASCKRIRDDGGYWAQIEDYITTHSEAVFSHGLCPECVERLYPEDAG